MSILFFKKPKYVPWRTGPLTIYNRDHDSPLEDCRHATIPPELSFENVICNKCAGPCSVQDFLDYLMYIERRAENLQFYLWMVDYHQRFRKTPRDQTNLSPRWIDNPNPTFAKPGIIVPAGTPADPEGKKSIDISTASSWEYDHPDVAELDAQTMSDVHFAVSPVKGGVDREQQFAAKTVTSKTSIQPFRAEVNKIIKHYLVKGSPRELNLTDEDRSKAINALRQTTHPSALSPVKRMLDATLRKESHPNFIRWSICNGTRSWTFALRAFAITNITIGFIIAILLVLSKVARWWRIFAAIEWWFGITNIIAASQGLCILLHRMHTRQYHAWEHDDILLEEDETALKGAEAGFIEYESTKPRWPVKMEVFGPANDYSGETWVRTESEKPWYRKMFERRIPVQEPGLRDMQNRMIRQAEGWALLITIPLTVVFVALPKGNFY